MCEHHHDHDHDHPHDHGHTGLEERVAMLTYMLGHNQHHTAGRKGAGRQGPPPRCRAWPGRAMPPPDALFCISKPYLKPPNSSLSKSFAFPPSCLQTDLSAPFATHGSLRPPLRSAHPGIGPAERRGAF